jgi:peptidoglycan-N-acetylglucosamine deacetylase
MKKIYPLSVSAFLVASSIAAGPASAAGPDAVGFSDRSLWPETVNSTPAFDRASRAEILVFAAALAQVSDLDAESLKAQLHIKQANPASVSHVRRIFMSRLLENWNAALASCQEAEILCGPIDSEKKLLELAGKMPAGLPPPYHAWFTNAQAFHVKYAGELIRLAALFPGISSEIDTFSPREKTGAELPDRQFLLTFDDGPSRAKGFTDSLLPILAKADLHATFYILGENLQSRVKAGDTASLKKSFQGQCVAMHGWTHKSHAKWPKWKESVTDTKMLVKAVFPVEYSPWFRPPYGQRVPDSEAFFKESDLQVALWNIDSQDWNNRVGGLDAAQRVFTLMLLWRHGVILFHDIHPKALSAVPWILEHTRGTGVDWKDCRDY